jgi:hypothetical protein
VQTHRVVVVLQALLRKLMQGGGVGAHGACSTLMKLQQEASPGDVLFLLRGLAAWQEPEVSTV